MTVVGKKKWFWYFIMLLIFCCCCCFYRSSTLFIPCRKFLFIYMGSMACILKEEYKPWKWGATARYYTSHKRPCYHRPGEYYKISLRPGECKKILASDQASVIKLATNQASVIKLVTDQASDSSMCFTAGHDTTASSVSWVLYSLCEHLKY